MQLDSRIRVYHKENEGLVAARKDGVALAKGDAVAFVDSDDWIEEKMYEEMAAVFQREHTDVVTSGLVCEGKNKNWIWLDSEKEGIYSRDYISENMMSNMAFNHSTGRQGIIPSVCNKLFEKSLLQTVLESIYSDLTLGEDGAVVYRTIALANKVAILNRAWYHYIERSDSMVRTYDIRVFEKIYKLEQ